MHGVPQVAFAFITFAYLVLGGQFASGSMRNIHFANMVLRGYMRSIPFCIHGIKRLQENHSLCIHGIKRTCNLCNACLRLRKNHSLCNMHKMMVLKVYSSHLNWEA